MSSCKYVRRHMMRLYGALVFLTLANVAGHSEGFKSLAYVGSTSVLTDMGKNAFAVQLPMKCGSDGLIYVRFAAADSESAVTLIAGDGKVTSSIRLSEIPEFSQNDFYDFAPGNGEVFVLSGRGKPHAPTVYYLSRFKIDGTYISSSVLDIGFSPDFEPRSIAAFPAGNLLVAGMAKGHDATFMPFTGIFSEDGRFLRRVLLKDDVTEEDAKQKQGADSSPAQEMRDLLEVSFLQTADDGNAYLMRHTPKGPIFVVSPGGSVRRVQLTPPAEGSHLQWIAASGGLIAAQYRSPDTGPHKIHYLVVFDMSSSRTRETVRYEHDYSKNGGGMACYQNGTYTFLAGGGANGGTQLVKAVAQ